MWVEAQLWTVLSAPCLAWFACAAAERGSADALNQPHMKIGSWIYAASALAALAAAATAEGLADAMASVLLIAALAYLAVFDVRIMAIPVWPTLAFTGGGLAFAALEGGGQEFIARASAVLAVWLAFRLLDQVYLRLRGRAGLGSGDALVAAMIGAWLPYHYLAWSVALGGGLALLWVLLRSWPADRAFPFVPGLGAGACLVMLGARVVWSF
jgi:prepilin signal peptidase PulO-like enzyme (type II secretory pathway)